jgi:phage FluMu gp28-like protein
MRGGDGNHRHGDSAIAGALAWCASYSNHQEYAYTAVNSRNSLMGLGGDSDDRKPTPSGTWGERLSRFRRGSW